MTIFAGIKIQQIFLPEFPPRFLPFKIQIGVRLICAWVSATRTPLLPSSLVGPRLSYVAGRQDAGGRCLGSACVAGWQRPGGGQAATRCILTYFPKIYINFYVNEARMRKPGRKGRSNLANFIRSGANGHKLIFRQSDALVTLPKNLEEHLYTSETGLATVFIFN